VAASTAVITPPAGDVAQVVVHEDGVGIGRAQPAEDLLHARGVQGP
jgi:hypothetical protein